MAERKLRVGVIGLGMMGNTHLEVYARRPDVEVVAVADQDAARLSGSTRAGGNIEGQAKGSFDLSSPGVQKHQEGAALIADPNVEIVDVCSPTPVHLDLGLAALQAGKHVLIEKPLARTHEQAKRLADTAERAQGVSMAAMCMRFWPGWDWLREAVEKRTYGRVRAATFRRVAQHPGGGFYRSGDASGGAILDLHIHDSDFIRWALGTPHTVTSYGYSHITDAVDHIVTRYGYGTGGPLVVAEGGWAMSDGFGFSMRYTINFEEATADFDLGRQDPLLIHRGGETEAVQLADGIGYDHEIAYFLDCIKSGRKAERVTLDDAARSVLLIEAEAESVRTGNEQPVIS